MVCGWDNRVVGAAGVAEAGGVGATAYMVMARNLMVCHLVFDGGTRGCLMYWPPRQCVHH